MTEGSHDEVIIAAATTALGRELGQDVVLEPDPQFGGSRHRSTVFRARVDSRAQGAPETVIVKALTGSEGRKYDPSDGDGDSPAARFAREYAAARFLQDLPLDQPLSARLLAADASRGVIVLEDLGDGQSLADLLQGGDANSARRALVAYASSLGRLHGVTAGLEASYETVRSGATRAAPLGAARVHETLPASFTTLGAACERLGVEVPARAGDDMDEVLALLSDPGPFLAFSPGDTCPDNHRLNLAAGSVRFFDFEFSSFQHALLDAAYLLAPFPTCWCVNRLPAQAASEAEDAYRSQLAALVPAASGPNYERGLTAAVGYWAVVTTARNLEASLKANGSWGISSTRQRHPLRLENFASIAARSGSLPALAGMAAALAARLRELWDGEAEMPLYPPFRGRQGEAARSA
ncbi:MAG TPA: phosphotransferase [Deinococcales bacterium]|nr:phosphotransferase [Deinococcales bacterium]